jgi:hypothetical protein
MTRDQIKKEILKLNGYAFISFEAQYDISKSILKAGSKKAQAALLESGIDRSKMFKRVVTHAHLATTKRGYNEFVENEFKRAGIPTGFKEWKSSQVEKYGKTYNGTYERIDENNAALEIGKNDTEYLVIFRAKNLETDYYYIDEQTKEKQKISLDDSKLVDFQPKSSVKYLEYTEYEQMVRKVRDRINIRKPKLDNIRSINILGNNIDLIGDHGWEV